MIAQLPPGFTSKPPEPNNQIFQMIAERLKNSAVPEISRPVSPTDAINMRRPNSPFGSDQMMMDIIAQRNRYARPYEPGEWDKYVDTGSGKDRPTGMEFYDTMLNKEKTAPYYNHETGKHETLSMKDYYRKSKGRNYELVLMSPEEYFQESNKMHGGRMTDEEYKNAYLNSELVDRYEAMTRGGSKMPLPFIDYKDKSQEGRHRSMVAKRIGLKEYPVLKVYPS